MEGLPRRGSAWDDTAAALVAGTPPTVMATTPQPNTDEAGPQQPEPPSPSAGAARPRRRRWRWLRRIAAGLFIAVVLIVTAAALVLRNLDRPWVKRRVQALARDAAGLELDYAATRVRLFEGLRIEGLVVRTPAPLASAAPELARVGSVEIGWSARALVGLAGGPRFASIALSDVALTVVRAADGRTSFSLLGGTGASPSSPTPPSPPTPPSRLLSSIFGSGAPIVGRAAIDRAALTLVLLDETEATRERFTLEGISLVAETARAGSGWRAEARLGTAEAPLALRQRRERRGAPAGEAALKLAAKVTADASEADARIDLTVDQQTFAPALHIKRAVGLEARARADAFNGGRLTVTVARAQVADDAALVDAELELGDAPASHPRISHANADVDLVRLLGLLPDGLVPVRARRAHAKAKIERLLVAIPPRLELDGVATIDAELAGVLAALGAKSELSLASARVHASGRPAPDGATAITAKLPLGDVSFTLGGGRRVVAGDLTVGAGGRVDRAGVASGDLTVGANAVDLAGLTGADPLALRALKLGIALAGLRVDVKTPLASRGRVAVSGEIGSVALGRRLQAEGAQLSLSSRLTGGAPFALEADVPLARLRVNARDGHALVDDRAHVALALTQAHPDGARPLRSRGVVHATVELGALKAIVDATKRPDAVEFMLDANAEDLKTARLVAASALPAGWQIPWDRVGLAVRSKGTITQLASPAIAHTTEVRLDRPALVGAPLSPSAKTLTIGLTSHGSLRAHEGDVDLRVVELTAAGSRRGDGRLAVKFALDPAAATGRVSLTGEGEAAPSGTMSAAASFDRARRALLVETDGELGRLTLLGPLLAAKKGVRGLDLARLSVGSRTRLTITGVVDDVGRDGAIRLAPAPLATIGLDGTVSLHAANVRWAEGDREVRSPRFSWRGEVHTVGTKRTLTGALELAGLRFAVGEHLVEMDGVRDATEVEASGDLRAGEVSYSQVLWLTAMRQDIVPQYPVGDLALELRARRTSDGVIHVDTVGIDNDAAGTSLSLNGGLDFGEERRSLSLRGTLSQDLGKVWTARQTFIGRGALKAVLRVDSADLSLYHALASLTAQSARVELPRARMLFDGVDGEIPLTADIVLGRKGAKLLQRGAPNTYSELRFADQHPLLTRRSFITARRVETPFFVAAPVAGNLRIEHNIISLSQLEMGLRGGRVTGRCLIDHRDDDNTLQLHVRASQVQSSRGEPFDGNAAVTFSTRERSLDGRAEILRIGRRHLLDLLDLHDPHRADASVNRIRKALAIGYPDHVRLGFSHGFASARVTLGGLGALVRIDELRGIPLGPILDKALAPLSPRTEEEQP